MKQQITLGFTLIAYALCSNFALAIGETETNNSFLTRNVFAPGTFVVNGELTPAIDLTQLTPDFTFTDTLDDGAKVSSYSRSGLSLGTPFFAALDNSTNEIDTLLGLFDENDSLIAANDDDSPFGTGLASALGGQVNPDGSINIKVTGVGDENFTGLHDEVGRFDLNIYLGFDRIADVDFFSFTGLTPGVQMTAKITSADFDTTLGLFDDNGILIDWDDDNDDSVVGDLEVLSLLLATVPETGTLNFAVSGYPDLDFVAGSIFEFGQYQLTITQVPIPAAVWLFAGGLLGLIGLGNRNRLNSY